MNQQERIDSFIADYQKLRGNEVVVTNETKIKGTSIDRICQIDSAKPYRRMRQWLTNALKKKEIEEAQNSSPKLFDKPVKEKKVRKAKKNSVEIQGIEIPELLLSDILTNFKIGKLSLQDTVFIIKQHYKK